MNKYLDANAIPLQLPIGSEEDFAGLIDIVNCKAYEFHDFIRVEVDIPEAYKLKCKAARNQLVEKLAEFDDEVMELYLGEKSISAEQLKSAIRSATLKLMITPVLCGAAYKNKGMQLLLDAIVDYLPSPGDIGAIMGIDIKDPDKSHTRCPSPKDPFSALAFKIIHDPYVGQQTFIRIFSGTLKNGMLLFNTTKGKNERTGRILKIRARERIEISEAGPGEIVALVGMKLTRTGDTLCDPYHPLYLESIHIPPSVIELKVSPSNRKDRDKFGEALNKLVNEDPSFNFRYDHETNETVIAGMGELHLEIIADRLREEFKVAVDIGEPSVSLRETLTMEVVSDHKYAKQTGGRGQFAHTVMRLEPNEGMGFEFVDNIKGGAIPAEYIPSVSKGIKKTMDEGILSGFPVVDVKAVLIDGKYHPVDSSDTAFQTCASICFKNGFLKAKPVLLEPIMKIEINTPDDYIGDIINNLNKKRGKIESMRRYRKGSQKLNGLVPLMEMFGYATQLRNMSSGRANYSMEFHQYMPLPVAVQEEVLTKLKKK